MMRLDGPITTPALLLATLLLVTPAIASEDASLDFTRRVEAEGRIARLRSTWSSGVTATSARPHPPAVLESRVMDALRRSAALESIWHRPIVAADLAAETTRIVGGTKWPERLDALAGALDNDPFLFQECVARTTLARRLTRNLFAYDSRIHAAARAEAESMRRATIAAMREPDGAHPDATVTTIFRTESAVWQPPASAAAGVRTAIVGDAEFLGLREALGPVGAVGPLRETPTAFTFRVPLDEADDHLTYAEYVVRKRAWDDWWSEVGPGLDTSGVRSVANDSTSREVAVALGQRSGILPNAIRSDGATCPASIDDTWLNGALDAFPERSGHTAVWTGDEVIYWGGERTDDRGSATGARYDPVLDAWSTVSSAGAPGGRFDHVAVWTGGEMIVWGGCCGTEADGGGRYDPSSDTWSAVSVVDAPDTGQGATAVWTGEEMIVWGGTVLGSPGGRYDPASDTWAAMQFVGQPAARRHHAAVWAGSEMIVWGGEDAQGNDLASGARYVPAIDRWYPLAGSPLAARRNHTAVWSGDEMLVWGGLAGGSSQFGDGAAYAPATAGWRLVADSGAPSPRVGHAAVWTGDEMLIWAGINRADGARYDPASDAWSPMAVPAIVASGPAAWTGAEMIVHGGPVGARYRPADDTWTAVANPVPLAPRSGHAAVWTGNEMIVWGGAFADAEPPYGDGGGYDPVLDSWRLLPGQGAPAARSGHVAVWTGSVMLVWGPALLSGGRYDPLAETWSPMSSADSCAAGTAMWTGTELLLWNGELPDPGCRYDPTADAWSAISTTAMPAERFGHTAVWTGDEMIVWGGTARATGSTELDSGGRYAPGTDSWSPTSTAGAPSPRAGHVAVWTGQRMLVWGSAAEDRDTVGVYDPVADAWTLPAPPGGPYSNDNATAVWTGDEMIVWGGGGGEEPAPSGFGGRFDPLGPTWRDVTLVDAPSARYGHTAVWTGDRMLVWGGSDDRGRGLYTGGGYVVAVDGDGDGVEDACDCAPDDGGSFDVPAEIAGLRWQADAATLVWDSDAAGAGTGTVYDVLRDDIVDLPVGSGGGGACLEVGSADTLADGSADPTPGSGYYYLVRGRNACGDGPYGTDSAGSARVSTVCPTFRRQ